MKLWYSFTKELSLSSKSMYFYMEIIMAAIFLFLLLFVIPENFSHTSTEYLYLDMNEGVSEQYHSALLKTDIDNEVETVLFEIDDHEISTLLYSTKEKDIYVTSSKEDVVLLAEKEKNLGAVLTLEKDGLHYEYYLQGYESEKLRNLYTVMHAKNTEGLVSMIEQQEIVTINDDNAFLTDRENFIPVFLTFNGSLMGLFIIAAYIFLDKKEGIITAYAVTASSVWHYLLSKIGVVLFTSVITSLIIVIPIMGLQANYLVLIIFLLTSGFFISALGLYISSFYSNIMQAFGAIYSIIIVLMLPNIAYFIPSWEPVWIKYIPSYTFLQSFKESIIVGGDITYALTSALAFLIGGIIIFILSNYRYKSTLTVSG